MNNRMSNAIRLVSSAVYALGYPDRVCVLSLIGELGRVVKHEHCAPDADHALSGSAKVSAQMSASFTRSLSKKR